MELGSLYQFVLLVVLVAMIIGVGVLILDKFQASTGVTTAAQTAINASRTEVSGIATNWLGLIVTIVVLAIILGIVLKSFAGSFGR